MRRSSNTSFAVLAALVVLLLTVLAVGCGGDDTSNASSSGTPDIDAGRVDAAQPDVGSTSDGPTTPFNLTSATSTGSTRVELRFDGVPDPDEAGKAESYSITGLGITEPPTVNGQVVTLTTEHQSAKEYTVVVASSVTRVPDGERLTVDSATFTGTDTFNVASAVATDNTTLVVTFDDLPDIAADDVANYDVPGLTLTGPASAVGNVVTLVTSPQAAQTYTLTVSNVTRLSDGAPLAQATATFEGSPTFDVVSAAASSTTKLVVTFSGPPNAAQATDPANYSVPGLTLSAPELSGSVVTLTTTQQLAQSYTLTVSNVTRASDAAPLVTSTAAFTGRTPFAVVGAQSTSSVRMTVTFDAPPDAAQATNAANYSVPGLTVSAPELSGDTVTLTTTGQQAQSYTVTVSNVTRASDGEPLTTSTATFDGTPVQAPTVTNVVVTATSPDNGPTPYNTGTTTVVITGTDLATVDCAGAMKGVKLDDADGAEPPALVGTTATACTVDSDGQITATFPAGIRTNGATGWNVIVTNQVGSNATSAVRFVPVAGLLISEVFTGVSGGTDREFVEIYNPTANSIDTTAAGIELRLHIRNSTGSTDTNKNLSAVTAGVIPSHGFLLLASSQSEPGDAWYDVRDYTYSAASNGLVGNGGVYISLSDAPNARVIDKVGWGTQPAGGYEGTALANVPSDESAQRRPGGGAGHATDTDVNADDWLAPSATITPRGTASAAEP